MTPPGIPQAEQAKPGLAREGPAKPPLRMFFWCLAIALGALAVWAHRNDMSPDGVSYVEMAEAAARGNGHALVNGYWSPLYPLLLSASFRLFHPAMYWEFALVHAVNFALYLADLFCLEIFFEELLAARRAEGIPQNGFEPLGEKTLWILAYLLFLWSSQFWLSPAMVNPDIIVAGLAYLATALLLRIYQGKATRLLFAGLGAFLGVAYLAKAAMFPVSFVFLACGFLLLGRAQGSYRSAWARSALALAVFLSFALPLVVALSNAKHRVTFGDSGRINYAESVNRAARTTHWQGQPAGTGIPLHPTRMIFGDPLVYEFAQPVQGSYPPWYDPSYWYEGIRPHFSWKGQLFVLYRSANSYLKLLSRSGALYVVFLALIVALRKGGTWEWGERRLSLVGLPSLATLAMYSLVLVEQRYVSPFVLMLLLWMVSSARVSTDALERLRKRAVPAAIVALSLATAWPVTRDLQTAIANRPYEHWEVAIGLHALGIPPGTEVGTIGSGLDAYWAHLAGVRIVAEIPDKDRANFFAGDSVKKREALRKFLEVGAKAVVTKNVSAAGSMDEWQEVGQTHYYLWRALENIK